MSPNERIKRLKNVWGVTRIANITQKLKRQATDKKTYLKCNKTKDMVLAYRKKILMLMTSTCK